MTLRSVSATQIKQHRSCALQWYLQRIEGWEMPQSPSQALGEAIHKQIEDYLLDGKNPDLPSVENAMKKGFVPPTGGAYLVEEPKDYGMSLTCADVPVKGRIDLLVPPTAGESLVKVVDWKSASSFRYVPEPDVLTRDVQGVLYLKYAFANYPLATHGQFRHVYLLTKGTGSKKVDAEVVDREFIDGQWAHIEATVEEMKATATRPLPIVAQSQANLSHCDSYGGCSFRDRCPAASKGLVASMFEAEGQTSAPGEGINMSTLAEKLKARKAATQTVAAEGKTEAPVAVEPVAEAPQVVEAKAKTQPEVAAPVAAGVVPPDAPGGDLVHEKHDGVPPKKMTPAELRENLRQSGAIGVDKAKFGDEPKEESTAPIPVAESELREIVASITPEVAEVIQSAHDRWVAAGRPGPDPDTVLAAEYWRQKWIEDGKKRPLSLFIDCYPEKAEFETLRALEDEIAARTPSLLEHLRKTSPKDVPEGTVDLGEVLYGRGYSTLAASFAVKPLSGPWTVSTLGPASSKVLEVLLPKATFVVRGRR